MSGLFLIFSLVSILGLHFTTSRRQLTIVSDCGIFSPKRILYMEKFCRFAIPYIPALKHGVASGSKCVISTISADNVGTCDIQAEK